MLCKGRYQSKGIKARVKAGIKTRIAIFDISHALCLYVTRNYSKLCKIMEVPNKKFHNLELEKAFECGNPAKVIFNYFTCNCQIWREDDFLKV